jgi:hypothetical protein
MFSKLDILIDLCNSYVFSVVDTSDLEYIVIAEERMLQRDMRRNSCVVLHSICALCRNLGSTLDPTPMEFNHLLWVLCYRY